jgi:FkbH-like protein
MTLREAVKKIKHGAMRHDRHVALVCSFEPLHLATFLQANLMERFPQGAPSVHTWGYDQLDAGLAETASVLRHCPAFLFLSWEDLHPGLSWRSRSAFGEIERSAVAAHREELAVKLRSWMEKRGAAETYLALPPPKWLPDADACAPESAGPVAVSAVTVLWQVAEELSALGARLVRLPAFDLDFRGLLRSGCPLSAEASECTARRFVELAFPTTERKKAVVVDLDGTLWDGVIGEDGPQSLCYGADGKGFPFHIFQKILLKLRREGVLLAVCSKNNSEDVLAVFDSLDMPLKLADFAVLRCNWDSKSQNIASIAKELNLGCDSMVFIDDNEAELEEVAAQLAGLTVLRTPRECADWPRLFTKLQSLFAAWKITAEDRLRTESFTARPDAWSETSAASDLRHVSQLGLEINLKQDAFDQARSLELINKTNQFNLTGERISREEWLEWMSLPGAFCMSARLRDRYGDFGTVCVVLGRQLQNRELFIKNLVLSCRAFGRGVESMLLGELTGLRGAAWIRGPFRDTGRNVPARRFLEDLGCDANSGGEWMVSGDAMRMHAESVCQLTRATVRLERQEGVGEIICDAKAS